jgi:hypothetical protein
MFGMPKHRQGDPELTTTGVIAGMVVSVLATRFIRAAWVAAQREGAKQAGATHR